MHPKNNKANLKIVKGILALIAVSLGAIYAKNPKNIIFMICDGGGYNHVDASSYYEFGESGTQVYEQFPVCCAMSTYSASGNKYDPEKAWHDFKFVKKKPTDSAAAATAMACGIKTNSKFLGMTPLKKSIANIVEHCESLGRATGLVTTVPFSHATPAAFASHHNNRDEYHRIAEQMIQESAIDLIMGCGHPEYDCSGQSVLNRQCDYEYVDPHLWQLIRQGIIGADRNGDGVDDPWTLIEDREDFLALKDASEFMRVLGIPKVFKTLEQGRPGHEKAPPFKETWIETVPMLHEMTEGALCMLDFNPDGFFLMVEGGAVDWASHDNQSGRMIEEMLDFNLATQTVVNWIESHSSWEETLLIVTADHETGYLLGKKSGSGLFGWLTGAEPRWRPIENRGKNQVPGMKWYSEEHTNSLVPFYAKGMGAQRFQTLADEHDPVRGPYLDNAELGRALFDVMQQ
ncbi:alkaline phosphatase [bacterium]|nr:alkaline phosphatase [bacterium]